MIKLELMLPKLLLANKKMKPPELLKTLKLLPTPLLLLPLPK